VAKRATGKRLSARGVGEAPTDDITVPFVAASAMSHAQSAGRMPLVHRDEPPAEASQRHNYSTIFGKSRSFADGLARPL